MRRIEEYSKCSCGAIGVFIDGVEYFVEESKLAEFNLDISEGTQVNSYCNCNHCVNHWGIDLCGCGSGEPFGECPEEADQCEVPMQVLEGYTFVNGASGVFACLT